MRRQKKVNININYIIFNIFIDWYFIIQLFIYIINTEYTDDNALIAKNTSLIISRVPLTIQQKRSWDRSESQAFTNSKDEANTGNAVDLTRLDGSEDDKIRAMMTQSTQDYDPSKYEYYLSYTVINTI